MTTVSSLGPSGLKAPSRWVCILLGLVMVVVGFLVLSDVMLFTVVSTIFIGWMAIVAGGFEIVHSFWTKGWGGMLWQMLLGILYVAFGIALITQPLFSALILTYILGIALLISGITRIMLGISFWRQSGWIMAVSGLFGAAAGLIILTGFPTSGLWVLGMLLGIDLIIHGVGWMSYAWQSTAKPAALSSTIR